MGAGAKNGYFCLVFGSIRKDLVCALPMWLAPDSLLEECKGEKTGS